MSASSERAIEWYLKAARGGDASSGVLLGSLLAAEPDGLAPAQAREWIERAAEAKLPKALNALGRLRLSGPKASQDRAGALAASGAERA